MNSNIIYISPNFGISYIYKQNKLYLHRTKIKYINIKQKIKHNLYDSKNKLYLHCTYIKHICLLPKINILNYWIWFSYSRLICNTKIRNENQRATTNI